MLKKKIHEHQRKHGAISYLIITILLIGSSFIAGSQYPSMYIPFVHYISNLGGIASNPQGHQIWNICIILIGIILLFLMYYQTQKLFVKSPRFRLGMLFLGEISSIGLIFVGIFPEDQGILHIVPASICIHGFSLYYCISILSSTPPLPKNPENRIKNMNYLFISVLFVLYIGLLFRIFLPISPESQLFFLTTVPPYEWGIFCCIWFMKAAFSMRADFHNYCKTD